MSVEFSKAALALFKRNMFVTRRQSVHHLIHIKIDFCTKYFYMKRKICSKYCLNHPKHNEIESKQTKKKQS